MQLAGRRIATYRSGGQVAYHVVELTESFVNSEYLLRLLGRLKGTVTPAPDGPPLRSRVLDKVLQTMVGATHLLVELDYFDLDYRSDASETIARKHGGPHTSTDRLIFFKVEEPWPSRSFRSDDWLKLLDRETTTAIGYVLLRADVGSMVGRAIVPAPKRLPKVVVDVSSHVRTQVTERIAVAGRLMPVAGIPFMQQDGSLLTCAHVCAWNVHFSAAIRGLTRRRLTVEFHRQGNEIPHIARTYPSGGLADWQIATVLGKFDLPAEMLDRQRLIRNARTAEWYDRSELWEVTERLQQAVAIENPVQIAPEERWQKLQAELGRQIRELESTDPKSKQLQELKDLQTDTDQFWLREMVTRTVCQYLNSGFPSILIKSGHAWVITGYLRNKDMETVSPDLGKTDVASFIACDDQRGPFELVGVAALVQLLGKGECSIVIPLARSIWAKAESVERFAATAFADAARDVRALLLDPKSTAFVRRRSSVQRTSVLKEIDRLYASFEATRGGQAYSIRSYVVTSTDFKRGLIRRCKDEALAARVRLARFPKFLWVVEVMDRSLRDNQKRPSVVGEIVLDATDPNPRDTRVHMIHLPGLVQVAGTTSDSHGSWHLLQSTEKYRSGRFHASKDWMNDSDSVVSRSKYSI